MDLKTSALLAFCFAVVAVAHAAEDQTCSAATAQATYLQRFDSFRLSYFDGRGLAEVPRTLFATAGAFPGAGFEDVRMAQADFEAARGKGDLAKNLNRVPVLNHNGNVIGQSKTISKYIAQHFGLMGRSAVEAASIDAILEHLTDMKTAWRKVFPYKKEMTDEEKAAASKLWFETPPLPTLEGRAERQLRWFLGHIEQGLPGDGFSVGGRPSLADASFFNWFGEHAVEVKGTGGEPMSNLAAVTAVLADFPKLKAVVETFKNSPGMQHYLATRGKMNW